MAGLQLVEPSFLQSLPATCNPAMPTFKLTLAYDGTDFVGWQRQASGVSIQGLVEDALRELDGRAVTVSGAGRTDAGVHALGQVASFSLDRAIESDALARAVNARLPKTVRVVSAIEAPPSFHARFTAYAKTYRYRIWNGPVMSPFEHRYAWHVVGPLDVSAMSAAAGRVEGRHDFASFQATGSATTTTERTIVASRIEELHYWNTKQPATASFATWSARSSARSSDRRGRRPPRGSTRCSRRAIATAPARRCRRRVCFSSASTTAACLASEP
jgi:tRNA pseudouridine38-40 synthase